MFNNISNSYQLFFLIFLFLTFFTPSCASQEERLALAKQEVEIINSKLDKAEMVTGLMFMGENRYSYRAYFLDDNLVYIFSDINIGSRSASSNFYYFHNGNLIYLSQQEVGFGPGESKRKRSVKTDIYFDGKEVLESVRLVSGNYAEITQNEIDASQEEAEKLYNAAIEKKQSTTK